MSRTNKARWLGIVERHGEAVASLKQAGDCILVMRGYPRNLLLKCPDGCGEIITINLDPASGPSWKLYQSGGHNSLYPSVDLTSGCRSHFILWRDNFLWCDYSRNERQINVDEDLIVAVEHKLQNAALHFSEIAEQLGELPWEVLWGCRKLVRLGLASEKRIGYFSKTKKKLWSL